MELEKREQIKKVALEVISNQYPDQDIDMSNSPERETEINDLLQKALTLFEHEVSTPGQVDPQEIQKQMEEAGLLQERLGSNLSDEIKA